MIKSLALNSDWDLTLDAYGNLATVTGHERVAQDVAAACRLVKGEAIFHVDRGVPHFTDILGNGSGSINEVIIRSSLKKSAMSVSYVTNVEFRRVSFKNRVYDCELVITDELPPAVEYAAGTRDDFYSLIDVYETPNAYRIRVKV
jgi:hypothetical protein